MQLEPQEAFDEKLVMIFDTETLHSAGNGLPSGDSLRDPTRNTMYVDWVRTYQLQE